MVKTLAWCSLLWRRGHVQLQVLAGLKTRVTTAPWGEEGAPGAGWLWKALALMISFSGPL